MLLVFNLFLAHQFTARVGGLIWVTQSEDQVDGVMGGTVTLNCQIHSDSGDEISQCLAQWYIKVLGEWTEVADVTRLKSRIVTDKDASTTNTTLSIRQLTINDTDTYFCTLICKINSKSKQHHGNGTKIIICDHEGHAGRIPTTIATTPPVPEPASKAEDGLLPVPFYALLVLKLVVALVMGAFSATCQHC